MAANELLLLLLVKNLTGKLLKLESVKESRICRDLFCQSSAITFPKEEWENKRERESECMSVCMCVQVWGGRTRVGVCVGVTMGVGVGVRVQGGGREKEIWKWRHRKDLIRSSLLEMKNVKSLILISNYFSLLLHTLSHTHAHTHTLSFSLTHTSILKPTFVCPSHTHSTNGSSSFAHIHSITFSLYLFHSLSFSVTLFHLGMISLCLSLFSFRKAETVGWGGFRWFWAWYRVQWEER